MVSHTKANEGDVLRLNESKVLVIDDDFIILEVLREVMKDWGYPLFCTTSPNEALNWALQEKPDVAVVDYLMPQIDGLTFTKMIKEKIPDIEIIIITGLHDVRIAVEALRFGAFDYLLKPFQMEELRISIQRALEHRALVIAQKRHEEELERKIEQATAELVKLNKQLKETKEYLENLLNISVDGILILTSQLQISYANQGALNILKCNTNELENCPLTKILSEDEVNKIRDIITKEGKLQNYETYLLRKDGSKVPVNISFSTLKTENGAIHSIFVIFKDITTQKELEAQLKELSIKDSLTDLYNQRYFYARLESEIERARRQRHPLSLLLFDVDHFKYYNDNYGHLEGDKVLKTIGEVIKECTREHVDMGFRYGGDEFTVILPETDEQQAILVAERIRTTFQRKGFDKLSISIGVITYTEKFTPRSFIQFADSCMYDAKRAGGNRIVVYRPELCKIIGDENSKE